MVKCRFGLAGNEVAQGIYHISDDGERNEPLILACIEEAIESDVMMRVVCVSA